MSITLNVSQCDKSALNALASKNAAKGETSHVTKIVAGLVQYNPINIKSIRYTSIIRRTKKEMDGTYRTPC